MFPCALDTAFDPSSYALLAHMLEQTAFTFLCPIRRPRVVPRARQWLRINSEKAFEAMSEDMAESALDAVNSIEPHLAAVLVFIVACRVLAVANFSRSASDSETSK